MEDKGKASFESSIYHSQFHFICCCHRRCPGASFLSNFVRCTTKFCLLNMGEGCHPMIGKVREWSGQWGQVSRLQASLPSFYHRVVTHLPLNFILGPVADSQGFFISLKISKVSHTRHFFHLPSCNFCYMTLYISMKCCGKATLSLFSESVAISALKYTPHRT